MHFVKNNTNTDLKTKQYISFGSSKDESSMSYNFRFWSLKYFPKRI